MATSEKIKVAQSLHDGIAQDLIALGYSIDLLLAAPHVDHEMRRNLRGLRFDVDGLISKVRREIYQLRLESNGDFALTLENLARDICGERLNICSVESLQPQSEQIILTIAQELLRNAMKHSGGSEIDLTFTQIHNRYLLQVSDNGRGGAEVKSDRFGLQGVSEMADEIGAEISILSHAKGTKISILL